MRWGETGGESGLVFGSRQFVDKKRLHGSLCVTGDGGI